MQKLFCAFGFGTLVALGSPAPSINSGLRETDTLAMNSMYGSNAGAKAAKPISGDDSEPSSVSGLQTGDYPASPSPTPPLAFPDETTSDSQEPSGGFPTFPSSFPSPDLPPAVITGEDEPEFRMTDDPDDGGMSVFDVDNDLFKDENTMQQVHVDSLLGPLQQAAARGELNTPPVPTYTYPSPYAPVYAIPPDPVSYAPDGTPITPLFDTPSPPPITAVSSDTPFLDPVGVSAGPAVVTTTTTTTIPVVPTPTAPAVIPLSGGLETALPTAAVPIMADPLTATPTLPSADYPPMQTTTLVHPTPLVVTHPSPPIYRYKPARFSTSTKATAVTTTSSDGLSHEVTTVVHQPGDPGETLPTTHVITSSTAKSPIGAAIPVNPTTTHTVVTMPTTVEPPVLKVAAAPAVHVFHAPAHATLTSPRTPPFSSSSTPSTTDTRFDTPTRATAPYGQTFLHKPVRDLTSATPTDLHDSPAHSVATASRKRDAGPAPFPYEYLDKPAYASSPTPLLSKRSGAEAEKSADTSASHSAPTRPLDDVTPMTDAEFEAIMKNKRM
uniref:Uncharacterized protein n=1 Tax=Chromera velia CCMP2878 TaxID=1169474 RepID=A0A0G4IE17_9ALVE|eukprot:Cvel_13608.t1-p1 / transcript=Cvel_13608.t1 / gene=Cvel_13608 / organism=Chromera_velia_CCMP2878 / gene_product=hypothetical protein / transcript_product=hypothetical protein / location=Cvel_scaffold937:16196-23062(+) / protein_length=552 / sequence_SO=supercontig / SO=protein_coding / is_pseudo=false